MAALGGSCLPSLEQWRPWCGAPLLFRLADGVAAVAARCDGAAMAQETPRLLMPLQKLRREEVPLHLLHGELRQLRPPPCAASAAAAVYGALEQQLAASFRWAGLDEETL